MTTQFYDNHMRLLIKAYEDMFDSIHLDYAHIWDDLAHNTYNMYIGELNNIIKNKNLYAADGTYIGRANIVMMGFRGDLMVTAMDTVFGDYYSFKLRECHLCP